jgi:hypothetical protein
MLPGKGHKIEKVGSIALHSELLLLARPFFSSIVIMYCNFPAMWLIFARINNSLKYKA